MQCHTANAPLGMSEERFEPPERPEPIEGELIEDEHNEGASAPGVAFAYDTAKWQIEKQEGAIREANSRLGFIIAGVIAFGTWFFKDVTDPHLEVIVGIPLFVTLAFAAVGYVPRNYFRPPNPHGVTAEANNPPGRIKELVLQNMLDAYDANAEVLKAKGVYLLAALVLGVLTVLAGIMGKVNDGVVRLHGNDTGKGPAVTATHNAPGKVYNCGKRPKVHAQGNGVKGERSRKTQTVRYTK